MPEPQERTSRAQHTAGPWSYVPRHVAESEPEVRAPAGWLIACTASDYDARLIAAAPELLEALCDLIEQKIRHPGRVESASYLWDAAHEAIAKATGA